MESLGRLHSSSWCYSIERLMQGLKKLYVDNSCKDEKGLGDDRFSLWKKQRDGMAW